MMKRGICIGLVAWLVLAFGLQAQERGKNRYTVMFYNAENLFDIYDDPAVLDDEFTPDGPKAWTETKYRKKLYNLAEVIHALARANRQYPAVIGLSEVENRLVLDDLVSEGRLVPANYRIVHYDSPEARGVDVALLYRPDQFKYEWSVPIRTRIPERPDFRTRDILAVCGRIDGELFCFFVNHWSSRLGGTEASEYLRCGAAATLRHFADSLRTVHPDIKLVAMGDMNDNPTDRSLAEVLGAAGRPDEVIPGGFFNPFVRLYRDGYGSNAYQDTWSLFDNIVVNDNLLEGGPGELRLLSGHGRKGGYYGMVFKRSFMVQQKGQYRNYPFRTFSGNAFLGGYSDHFPVYITIGK